MTLKVERATRAFEYNGIKLADPGRDMTPEQVREFYANAYPEITSAAIEGPVAKGAVATYNFRRAVGTKGATDLRAHLARLAAGGLLGSRGHILTPDTLAAARPIGGACMLLVTRTAQRGAIGEHIPAPSELLPVLP